LSSQLRLAQRIERLVVDTPGDFDSVVILEFSNGLLGLGTEDPVDGAGVELLRELVDRGVEIVSSSLYVAELLRSRRERDKS